MAFNYPRTLVAPISHSALMATLDYDLSAIGKILMANDGRSAAERIMDYARKNLASFKKPSPLVPLRDDKDKHDDEEEEEEEDDDDEEEVIILVQSSKARILCFFPG
ncbi:uncharacterized protein [Triticum aestivum]|uniref:uncharacterized protein n=1 Tax=Triticum aestivum TaxID=4565 RepID=UPI001D01AAE9|nr:uncharacterized protein LOC123153569 [Triticum aestivum]